MVLLLSGPHATAVGTAAAPAPEVAALQHVGDLLALPLVEHLGDLLHRLDEGDPQLCEQPVLARERVLERVVFHEPAGHDARDVAARLLQLLADDASVLAQLVDRRDDRLLLTGRRLQAVEQGAEEPSARPASHGPVPVPVAVVGAVRPVPTPVPVPVPTPPAPEHLDETDETHRTDDEPEHRRNLLA